MFKYIPKKILFFFTAVFVFNLLSSCGIGKIYDGSFTKTLKTGNGIFASLCHENDIICTSSDNINQIKKTVAKLK